MPLTAAPRPQGDNTFTYNGILNLTGVQYSSVMFIGAQQSALQCGWGAAS